MELHTCRNCIMINQIVGNQTQKYSILSEENLVLHNLVINTRQSIRVLSEKLANAQETLAAERERNLQLYLKNNIGYNKAVNREPTNSPNPSKTNKACDECKKPECDVLQSTEYNNLLKVIKELQEKQQNILEMLHNENGRHTTVLNEHIKEAEEHASVVLEFNKLLRNDLFTQKKQNIRDRSEFLKTVDVLTIQNEKYIQEVKRDIVVATTKSADKLTKNAINSMCHQLHERDKLVATLRKQQTILQGQIDQLQNKEKLLNEEHRAVINKFKLHLKYELEKQLDVERQRKFDAEGFRNDIKIIRQEIKALKGKLQKLPTISNSIIKCDELINSVDQVSEKIGRLYGSRMSAF